jgi:hypothetical protein
MEQVKQTAVDWLADELSKYDIHNPISLSNWNILKQLIEQAKQMEKEQIIEAYEKGYTEDIPYPVSGGYYRMNAEQYYNETYGKDKSET